MRGGWLARRLGTRPLPRCLAAWPFCIAPMAPVLAGGREERQVEGLSESEALEVARWAKRHGVPIVALDDEGEEVRP